MSIKPLSEFSEAIENSRVKAIFEAEVDGRLRFRYNPPENDEIPVNHTIWVEEPDFDPTMEYKTGSTYNLLIEKALDEPDLLDPRAIVWQGSLRKFEKLQLWDKLEQFTANEEPIEGEIISINKGGLTVDIEGVRAFVPLSHAILPDMPSDSASLKRLIGEHDQFQLIEFDKKTGNVVASRKKSLEVRRKTEKSTLLNRLEVGQCHRGIVKTLTDYGAFVDIGGIDGLLHVSNMGWGRVSNPRKLYKEGEEIEVKVLKFEPKRKRLSLGVKQLTPDPWLSIEKHFSVGDLVKGKIVALPNFGVFVELAEGVEGLIHISEISSLSWDKGAPSLKKAFKKGASIEVKILAIDLEQRNIDLTLKQVEGEAWRNFIETYKEGDLFEGEIIQLRKSKGLRIKNSAGIIGDVSPEECLWEEKKLSHSYKVGQTVRAKILKLPPDEYTRVTLGIKQLERDQWKNLRKELQVGKKREVKVTRVVDFGAFAEIFPGIDGLIHISEFSEDRVSDPRSILRPGQVVNALVLSIDDKSRNIQLSLWRDEIDEETPNEYRESEEATTSLGDLFKGTFSKLTLSGNKNEEKQIDTAEESDPHLTTTLEMKRDVAEVNSQETGQNLKDDSKTDEISSPTEDEEEQSPQESGEEVVSTSEIEWPDQDDSMDAFAPTIEVPRNNDFFDSLDEKEASEEMKEKDESETTQEWLKQRAEIIKEDLGEIEEEQTTFEMERRKSSELERRGPSEMELFEKKKSELTQIEEKVQTLTKVEKQNSELAPFEQQGGTLTIIEKTEPSDTSTPAKGEDPKQEKN